MRQRYEEYNKKTWITKQLIVIWICVILSVWENHRAKGGFTPLIFRRVQSSPPDERKEGYTRYVTYQDLIQIGILIVALVNLIYQIYMGKK